MCRRIIESLRNLFNLLTGRGGASIEAKLDAIEERLGKIEDRLQSLVRFTSFAFIYGIGFAIIVIGTAVWPEYAAVGLSLMLFGLFLLVVASIFGLFYMRR